MLFWAVEGAGILWVSIKQQQIYRRFFGVMLIFVAGLLLISELFLPIDKSPIIFQYAFFNSAFIGAVIIAISASCGSWLLSRTFSG